MTDKFDPAKLRELHDVLRDNPFTVEFEHTGYAYNPHERELTRYLIKHRAAILAQATENAALKAEVARLMRHIAAIAAIGEALVSDDKTAIPGIIRSAANG